MKCRIFWGGIGLAQYTKMQRYQHHSNYEGWTNRILLKPKTLHQLELGFKSSICPISRYLVYFDCGVIRVLLSGVTLACASLQYIMKIGTIIITSKLFSFVELNLKSPIPCIYFSQFACASLRTKQLYIIKSLPGTKTKTKSFIRREP